MSLVRGSISLSDDPGEDRVNAEDNALAEDDELAAGNAFSRETSSVLVYQAAQLYP